MKKSENLLSRDNSMILRGVAILFIMLHNYLHLPTFGFPAENEMVFSSERAMDFFYSICNGSNIIAEFLSHLGWIGVPVFVFLTGYGVAHASPAKSFKPFDYIRRHYIKLLVLMLPAVLFFGSIDLLKGNIWPDSAKRISYLTMLVNFAYPYLNCNPGVYWYFGLTFQFYLLWAFFGKRMNVKNLVVWSIVLLGALFFLSVYGSSDALSIFRHCFTGWFPVFAIGVFWGLRKKHECLSPKLVWAELLLLVVLLGLVLLMSRWLATWIFVPIIALGWFIVIGLLLMRTRYLSEAFRWIGKYSACIFVCHPIARSLELNFFAPTISILMINLGIYVVLTIIIVWLYNKYYQWFLEKLIPKNE